MSSARGPVHRRTSKACEECRRRKAKCDGRHPCAICTHRGSTCDYRSINRARRSRVSSIPPEGTSPPAERSEPIHVYNQPELAHDQNAHRASIANGGDAVLPSQDEQGEEVYQSVNATESAMQLYYGPSSNFAFSQHIHKTFSLSTDPSNTGGNRSVDYFKQRETFFGTTPISDTTATGAGSLFLPFELAQEFLEKFLASIHHLAPFISPEGLRQMLKKLYGQSNDASLTPAKTIIVLLALTNGATLTSHSPWVETLHERAKCEAAPLEETVNLEAVQISLLLAHFQACCGRPNSAYLQLGIASRKAYAAGLHKDVEYNPSQINASERSKERQVTFWALMFWERWVSFWLGRPSSVPSSVISTPVPKDNLFIQALAELSRIISQSALDIYDNNRLPLPRLWEAAQHIRLELQGFQRRMEPVLGFRLDGFMEQDFVKVDQVFLMNFLMHTWMITFRPFLMIHLSWKRASARATGNENHLAPPPLPVDMWWLPEACEIAVDKACKLIHFFAEAADASHIVKGLVFSAFYLESACFLLVYDAMRDNSTATAHIVSLEEALTCLSKMINKGPIPIITRAIEQMLKEIKRVKQPESAPAITLPTPISLNSHRTTSATINKDFPSQPGHVPSTSGSAMPQGRAEFALQTTSVPFASGAAAFGGGLPASNLNDMDLNFDIFAPDLGNYFDFGMLEMPSHNF